MQEQPKNTVPNGGARRPNHRELIKAAGSVVAISGVALSVFCVSMFSFAGQEPSTKAAPATSPVASTSPAPTTPAASASNNAPATAPSNLTGIAHTYRELRSVSVPYKTHMKMSHDVSPGNSVIDQHGKPGVKEQLYFVHYDNAGKPVSYKMVSERIVQRPVDEIILAGIRTRDARALPSRSGSYDRIREYDMVATGYSPYEGSSRGLCANGMHAGYGVVAVDPHLIKLGSRLYINGYGYAIAGDTGGAIKGHRIDLGHTTYSEAESVGRRKVHVYVLSSPH